MPERLQYRRLAAYYDLMFSGKDSRGESERILALARQYRGTGGGSWLDVGCGTGRHLEFFRREYRAVGLDASPEMLRIARRRLPGVRLVRGDMRTFDLGERFDVVSCLFSAIAHLPNERAVAESFANFARHLAPGGVLIVEPFIDPKAYLGSGHIHLLSAKEGDTTFVRMGTSARRGPLLLSSYRYLIGREGHGIEALEETVSALMVPHERLVELLRAAGLRARFRKRGLNPGRGLLIGLPSPAE